MVRRQFFLPLLILIVAAVLRLICLDLKPPHFDEGINGWWCDEMAKKGYYAYDPSNYHGPLHFYVLFVFLRVLGRNLWALRLPVAIVGTATVGLVVAFRRYLGPGVAFLAGFALAISPGYVFYNRYSIHETWLVFFLILFVWSLCRLNAGADKLATWTLVLSVAGMILTKETYVIHLFAALLAGIFVVVTGLRNRARSLRLWHHLDRTAFLGSALVGVALIVFLYSGTFLNLAGLRGLFETFTPWTKTGMEAAGHGKPQYDLFTLVPNGLAAIGPFAKLQAFRLNWYWIKLLTVYEWFALAGVVLSLAYLFTGRRALRFLAAYAWLTLIAYSLIPYKTPWCIISIAWPFFFLCAAGLVCLRRLVGLVPIVVVATVLLGHDAWCMFRLNFKEYDNPRQMYAYVQTFRDYRAFVGPILREITLHPQLKTQLKGEVLLSSYFPIPWVLGELPHIGYYDKEDSWPKNLDADFIAAPDEAAPDVEASLTRPYFENTFRLRDGMGLCRAFFQYDRFKDVFPGRRPDFVPDQTQ
jgi:uncharacterized protein (TIGR03663 family)